MVYCGRHMTGPDLAGLVQDQQVTITAGVPTLWLGLLQTLEQGNYDISSLRAMTVGGSAVPRSMIKAYQEKFGVRIVQGWGMTEMNPLGTISQLKGHMEDWVFGCDICQDVCPWNRFAQPHQEEKFQPQGWEYFSTKDWEELTEETFGRVFKKSAVKRTKFGGLTRNVKFVRQE